MRGRGFVIPVTIAIAAVACTSRNREATQRQAPGIEASPEPSPTESPEPIPTTRETGAAPLAPSAPAPAPKEFHPDVVIEIRSDGNDLRFVPDDVTVKAGQNILLVFKNEASRKTGFRHNWVLVLPGRSSEVAALGPEAGTGGGDIFFEPYVLANSHRVPPGGETRLAFEAPRPGVYPFICTEDGHWKEMRGLLRVVEVD